MSVILETSRLRLKPILESELDILHRILVDSYVRKYLCDDKVFSIEQTTEMLQESQKRFQKEKLGLGFIETKNKKETIGFVGLLYFFNENQPLKKFLLSINHLNPEYITYL